MIRAVLIGVLLACSAAAAQPAAQPGAGPDAAAPRRQAEIQWPARSAEAVRELEAAPWTLRWVGGFGLGFQEADREDAAIIRGALAEPDREVTFEGEGSVVVRLAEPTDEVDYLLAGEPTAIYQYLSATDDPDGAAQIQRTWLALYGPLRTGEGEPDGAAPRGLVVLLPGMFGTPDPVVDSLTGMLRRRGWHVLRMLTHSSRFTERAAFVLDPQGDITGVAGKIAEVLGDRAAECAFAVDAVCAQIAAQRPEVPVDARIGVGMSGGGMILPTVIAHNPGAYRAAVLIGAGADFAQIAIDSNYTDWIDSVRIGWEGKPDDGARRRFTDAYRAAAHLDSYATAPALAGLPMLMIHGERDRAVPAALGDLLWRRLGEPERWTVRAGHEVLFLVYLPSRAPALLEWLDRRGETGAGAD